MRRRFVAFLLLAWGVGACGALLGIDQLPLLDEGDAAVTIIEAGDAADAAPLCIDDLRLGCQNCPHGFCDDFDLDATIGARWISPVTPSGGPIFRERTDGGVRGGLVTDNVSPPFGFGASVSTDSGSSFFFLVNQVAKHVSGPSFAGVRYRFQTSVQALDLSSPAKLSDSGAAIFAGLGPSDISSAVIALFLTPKGLSIALGTNFFQDSAPDGSAYSIMKLEGIGAQPLLIDVYVTTRERALAEKLLRCEPLSSPTVVAVRVNTLSQGCYALEGPLADLEWTREPAMLLGASTFGVGTVALVHDNVQVDFLE